MRFRILHIKKTKKKDLMKFQIHKCKEKYTIKTMVMLSTSSASKVNKLLTLISRIFLFSFLSSISCRVLAGGTGISTLAALKQTIGSTETLKRFIEFPRQFASSLS